MTDSQLSNVILHDSISLDGSFVGFEYTNEMMALHYQIAGGFNAPVRLMGSQTCLDAIDLFGGMTDETAEDRIKPQKSDTLSYWAIPDSKAQLMGKLHYFRRSEFCRDIVLLISEQTPQEYRDYLDERHYDYEITGDQRADLQQSLAFLVENYQAHTILVDSGRGLTNALMNQGLIDQVSLLVQPVIIGAGTQNLFSDVLAPKHLQMIETRHFPGGYQWLLYKVIQ